MTPAKLVPLILAAVLGLSGCASHSSSLPGRSGPSKIKRTAEKLRLFEGPLSITVDPKYGYGVLDIPTSSERSVGLVIPAADMSKVEPKDKTRTYEVRYWYYEESLFADVMIGRGELVSIRSKSGTVLDLSRCELHDLSMVRRPVPITYGLPMRDFLEAMKRDFPNPAFTLGGCVVDEGSPKKVPHYVCPKCVAAAKAWSATFAVSHK